MSKILFQEISGTMVRSAFESAINVGDFLDRIHFLILDQIRWDINNICYEYRAAEIDYDNALSERAQQIIDGDDPDEDGRETIDNERYQEFNGAVGRLSRSLPRYVEYIIASYKNAKHEIDYPKTKKEAISLIIGLTTGDPYTDYDEDEFHLPKIRYPYLDRILDQCSFAFCSDESEDCDPDNIPF